MTSADGEPDGPAADVVSLRRRLHAFPELAYAEHRTTDLIVEELTRLGLSPQVMPVGTGVLCDLGGDDGGGEGGDRGTDAGGSGPVVALRADIDALPIPDEKSVPYRSTVDGVCHGCGHDAHTAILLAAAAELARQNLPGRVRLVFQPAEESLPGGALAAIEAGALKDVELIFALHCDPRLETGRIGLRTGPITAACDHLQVTLSGAGGHTARPHLTADLVYALGRLITEVPALLSRRVDPRAAVSLVWGTVSAGRAVNAIPMTGRVAGTLRVLDRDAWDAAEPLVRELVADVVAASGARAEVQYVRGVPPVDNEPGAVAVQHAAAAAAVGADNVGTTEQSMGGEDFAWYLEGVSGALARLGVRRPGAPAFDLHQGTFDIDEDALAVGVRYTVALAREALTALRP